MRKVLNLLFFVAAALVVVAPVLAGGEEKAEDTDNKFSVHGEIRVRGEYAENYADFDDDLPDGSDFYTHRYRVAAKGDLGKNVWVYGEVQGAGIFGDDLAIGPFPFGPLTGFEGEATVDTQFYQGWVALKEIGGSPFSVKFGRQEIQKGTELLWGNLDFYNGTVHDGVTAYWDWDKFKISAWWTRPFEDAGLFGFGGRDQDENFYAGSATWLWGEDTDLDVYAIWDRDDTDAGVGLRDADFFTIGARTGHWETGNNVWNWNAEFATQSGDIGAVDKGGSVLEGTLEYMWETGTNTHSAVHLTYTTATGDDPGTGGEDEEFDPLFQDFHHRLGLADLFKTANIDAIEAGYKMAIGDNQKWGINYIDFTANEEIAAGIDDLGSEIDAWYKFMFSENVDFDVALALYQTGDIAVDALEDPSFWSVAPATANDDLMRLYAQVRARW